MAEKGAMSRGYWRAKPRPIANSACGPVSACQTGLSKTIEVDIAHSTFARTEIALRYGDRSPESDSIGGGGRSPSFHLAEIPWMIRATGGACDAGCHGMRTGPGRPRPHVRRTLLYR